MAVVFASLDLGYQAYLKSVVQGALNDIARTASIEAPNLNCPGPSLEDQVKCAVKKRSGVVARSATYDLKIQNFFDFSTIGRSEKIVTDYNGNGRYDRGDCFVDLNRNNSFDLTAGRTGVGGADDVSFYQVTVTMPRLFPVHAFLPVSPNYQIHASMALRNQPYTRQNTPPTICV